MRNKLSKNCKKILAMKKKQSALNRFFNAFLPEARYRNTKIEHPKASRKDIFSFLK